MTDFAWLDEIQELLADNWFVDNPNGSDVNEAVAKLIETVKVMREALEKYGDPENWFSEPSIGTDGMTYVSECWKIKGFGNDIAREALEKCK